MSPGREQDDEWAGVSDAYRAAVERHNVAIKKFAAVTQAYRDREIDDDSFLEAREEYDRETALFDEAFEAEENREPDEEDDDFEDTQEELF